MIAEILHPVAICLILLLIDVTVSPWISIQGWSPDLLLIYVMLFSAQKGKNGGLLVGLFAGILQDFTGGVSLGLLALAKSNLGFWFGYWIEKNGISLSIWLMSLIILISVLIQDTWVALFTLQGSEIEFGQYILGNVLPISIYSAFIALLFIIITGKTLNKVKKGGVLR